MSDDYKARVTPTGGDIESATQARAVLKATSGDVQETAARVSQTHDAVRESVKWNPDAGDSLDTYDQVMRITADTYDETVTQTIDRSHEADWARIADGSKQAAAWDVSKNQ